MDESIHTNDSNPTLSLCMIVKNEERFLGRCLKSVKDLVLEMVIVDTGSTDGTIAIAEKFGARIVHHPWQESFSEARNFGLQFAKGDWLLQLDADEELFRDDIPLLRETIRSKRIDAYSVILLNEGPDSAIYKHRNIRLFRRGHVRYEGIVHNVPVVRGDAALSSIRILHHGYHLCPEGMMKKFKRSETLLLKQIRQDPGNTYAQANLIRNFRLQKRFADVIREGEKFLQNSKMRLFDRQMILNDLIYAYFITGNYRNAEQWGLTALKENPSHLDVLFVMGGVMIRKDKPDIALNYFRQFLDVRESEIEAPGLESLLLDTYGYQGRAWNNIGSCYLNMGKINPAIAAYEKAIRYEPENCVFYKNLAGAFIQKSQLESCQKVLEEAVRLGIADEAVRRTLDKMNMVSHA